jgi:caffeoyl-CoA O-methyltransferase
MHRRDMFASLTALPLLPTAIAAAAQPQRRAPSQARPLAKDDVERRILGVLDAMQAENRTYLSVPPQDGRWLRVLAESTGAKHVVEVGTSTGYSGLWFALALSRTHGKLTTFEIDKGRADAARQNFTQAGVESVVTIVLGDAHEKLTTVAGEIDVAFIDADKDGYPDYLATLGPKMRAGGLILAHNTDMVPRYIEAVSSDPQFETVYYLDGGGLAITLKKLVM